jgi:hypothetical protein
VFGARFSVVRRIEIRNHRDGWRQFTLSRPRGSHEPGERVVLQIEQRLAAFRANSQVLFDLRRFVRGKLALPKRHQLIFRRMS